MIMKWPSMVEESYLLWYFPRSMTLFENSPKYEDLPQDIPIFPLNGVLILPGSELPLHIFEKRYIQMLKDSIKTSSIIGIVQPLESSNLDV